MPRPATPPPKGKPRIHPDKAGETRDIKGRHTQRTKPGLPARGAALDMLRLIRNGRSLDEAMTLGRSFRELEGADRAFARTLATTVLRHQGSLDELIDTYLNTPLKPNQQELRAILRLAAVQFVLLDTPPHAAASTSVDLARERSQTAGFAKLINAICRRMTETGKERFAKASMRADTPGWLWRRWERVYGPAKVKALATAHRQEPPLDITVKDPATRDALAEALEATPIGPVSIRKIGGSGRIDALPGYEEGQWWVQDVAATLPTLLAGDVAGKTVYDLCAAPGGKTMQFAARGAHVTALDISPGRIERMAENLERTGLTAQILNQDILVWHPKEKADVVLLDAPCTATGTIRRNPDLLWSKQENEVDTLARLQDRMIDRALTYIKPGGMLIFATCSLLPEEGEKRIEAALERHPNLSRQAVTAEEVGGLPVINMHGDLRCLPSMLSDQGGMDGFFASRLILSA